MGKKMGRKPGKNWEEMGKNKQLLFSNKKVNTTYFKN
jgi:hypothetical protein